MNQNRADHISAELQELIFSGVYKDGDRLDEISLAERFDVSRTPMREALKKLASSGLVEHIPHRGVFVRQPGPIELLEMFEVMSEFEAICGKLAAARISESALDDLKAANSKCQTAKENNDVDGYYLENERFHQIIYKQSGNAFLANEAQRLQKRLQPFRRVQLRFRGRIQQSMAEHELIVKALSSGDAELAESTLREHVSIQGNKFHQLIASFGKD
ncbi:MAG: GntR family transcriptional regulator [Hyphomicrobiales bacterium]|nr:MAG: GntR family transcriptional regulator [Hyphomicrobiales bacterium]